MAVVVSKLNGVIVQLGDMSKKMDDRPTWPDVRAIEKNLEKTIEAQVAHRETVTAGLSADVSRLDSWQTWAGRLVGGAVVTTVIGAFFILNP